MTKSDTVASSIRAPADTLKFPHPHPPAFGETIEIAPGILWLRLTLPFLLDHVNIYLIEDGCGWALLDTGLGDQGTQQAWANLLAGPLEGYRITQIIATHLHPDHVGCAGFLLERFDVPLVMTATEYLLSLNTCLNPEGLQAPHYRRFYADHGLDPHTTELVVTQGHAYLRMMTRLPPTFRRVVAGDALTIGGRRFEVLTGAGHSPEQIMLYCADEGVFLAADQVLAKISPNVSVSAIDPDGDPLGLYLRSLDALKRDLPADVLVLPGHNLPFRGLHTRINEIVRHHETRCGLITKACSAGPKSAAELVPFVFTRKLDPHQMGFAFSEVLAHVNLMLRQGELISAELAGTQRYITPA